MIVFDIETDGLRLDDITKIHCICVKDLAVGISTSFSGESIKAGVKFIEAYYTIIGHNIIAYDIPVIQKFFPWFTPNKVIDTLVLARMLEPDRAEGHGLESYAPLFGHSKIQNQEWSEVTENIIERCKSDVEINTKLYEYFDRELKAWDWSKALELEQEIALIIHQQERNGWKFDKEKALGLVNRLIKRREDIDQEVSPLLKAKCVHVSTVNKPFKKDGGFSSQCLKYTCPVLNVIEEPELGSCVELLQISGPFSVLEFVKPDLNSEKQMKELLLSLGWRPTEWNYKKDKNNKGRPLKDERGKYIKTSPKLTEESYDSLPEGLGKLLAERLKCGHRLHQIEGLIKNVRADGRIEAQANPCGTNTARMKHKIVVNIPKNDPNVFLGKEMRELFMCEEGRVLVGCDASSLEWRIAAHYINHPVVTDLVTSGDIHMYIADLAGITDRAVAKQLGYGILYGAGDKRVADILGADMKVGARIRNKVIEDLPGLKVLLERIEKATNRGYLKGIDGRKLFIRSKHSALNVLIQSTGSIMMKKACALVNEYFKNNNVDALQVGMHHDEYTFDTDIRHVNAVRNITMQMITMAGKALGIRIPMLGEAKAGKTWSEIH